MTNDLLNQENERLTPVNEVERLSGVPYNTLRYYTKIGLLPHMKRKRPHPEATSTVGHYPQSVLELLQRIEELKAQGLSNDEIKKKLHEKEKTPQNAVSEGISQEEKPPQPPVSVPQPPPLDLIPVLHEERKQSDLLSQISHFLTNMIHAPLPAREPMWSKVASHALTLLLVFGALAILSFGFSDLTHARIKRLFGGFWDQYVERILPSNVLGIQQVASPIVDVNDVLEYRTGSVRLGTKFPLDVDAIFAKTVNIVEGAVLNTSRFLGTVFFGKSDSYFITPLGVASLKDVRAITISAETIKVKNLEVSGTSVGAGGGGEQAQGGDADTLEGEAGSYYLNWVNFSNKPTILSSLNTVTNNEGNINLIAGASIVITPDDGTNTITISSSAGSDADTLDGLDSLSFLRSDVDDAFTFGTLTFNAGTTLSIAGSLVLPSSSITGAGAGSGLDADLLDGQQGSYFLSRANHTGTQLSSTISDFDEASQDSVGGILTDTSSVNFTYNDALSQIAADVIPGGVDHGSLAGLGDDDHSQYLLASGTRALTGSWDAGSFEIRAQTFQSDATTGTAPFIIASTTPVSNLNADLLDGQHGTYYLDLDNEVGTCTNCLTTTEIDESTFTGLGSTNINDIYLFNNGDTIAGNLTFEKTGTATVGTQYPSYDTILQGSGWNTTTASPVDLTGRLRLITGSGSTGSIPYRIGIFDDTPTEWAVFDLLNQRLGIRTNNPQSPLEVNGDMDVVGGVYNIAGWAVIDADGTGQDNYLFSAQTSLSIRNWQDNTDLLTVLNGGDVGIGTADPAYNLEIQNTADAAIFLEADTASGTEDRNAFVKFSQDSGGVQSIIGTVGDAGKDPENNAYTDTLANATLLGTLDTNGNLQFGTNDAVRMTITTTGNVGIGTTGPLSKLSVGGVGNALWTIYGTGTDYGVYGEGTVYGLYGKSTVANGRGVQGESSGTGDGVYGWNTGTGTGVYGNNSSSGRGGYFTSSSGYALITGSGNVGIGTTNPGEKLDVNGRIRTTSGVTITGSGGYLQLPNVNGNEPTCTSGNYGVTVYSQGDIITPRQVFFCINNNGTPAWSRMRSDTGYSPDLAEYYYSIDDTVNYGDIVSVSLNNTVAIKKANADSDSKAIGIVSTKSGITLGEMSEAIGPSKNATQIMWANQYRLVALSGRVPTKVSTKNDEVLIGDPVTASDLPGIGKRASEAGQVVGKSLEPFNPDPNSCQPVANSQDINWEVGQNKTWSNTGACYRLPDGTLLGKIMTFVNVSWYDPDAYLTDTGDLNLEEVSGTGQFTVEDTKSSSLIERIAVLSEAVVANIKAGSAVISTLRVEELSIGDQNLEDYVKEIITSVGTADGGDTTQTTAEGVFEKITATILGTFEKLIAKTAKIALAIIQNLKVQNVEVTGPTLGTATLLQGESSVEVQNAEVSPDSRIFITPKAVTTAPLAVIQINEGESFTVSIAEPQVVDVPFDFWIVGKKSSTLTEGSEKE